MGVGTGLYMYHVVVKKFTLAISSPDEFLYLYPWIGPKAYDTSFFSYIAIFVLKRDVKLQLTNYDTSSSDDHEIGPVSK